MSVINKMLRDLDQRQATPDSNIRHRANGKVQRRLYPIWWWLLPLLVICLIALYQWRHTLLFQQNNQASLALMPDTTSTSSKQLTAEKPVSTALTVDTLPTENAQLAIVPTETPPPDIQIAQNQTAEPQSPTAENTASTVKPIAVVADNVDSTTGQRQSNTSEPQLKETRLTIQREEEPVQQKAVRLQQQALAAQQRGNAEQAVAYWQQLIALSPDNAQPYLALAALWLQYGQPQASRQVLQQAIGQGIVNADIQLMLAQFAAQQQAWAQVIEYLNHDVGLAQQPDYYGLKATALQQLGQHQQAFHWFSQLTLVQPQQARWWLGGGISLEALQQPVQAHQFYRQAKLWGSSLSAASRDFVQQRLVATE